MSSFCNFVLISIICIRMNDKIVAHCFATISRKNLIEKSTFADRFWTLTFHSISIITVPDLYINWENIFQLFVIFMIYKKNFSGWIFLLLLLSYYIYFCWHLWWWVFKSNYWLRKLRKLNVFNVSLTDKWSALRIQWNLIFAKVIWLLAGYFIYFKFTSVVFYLIFLMDVL